MSLTGKGSLSLRRQDVMEQKSIAVGFKKIVFAHKASGGETGLDLTALVSPPEMSSVGFINPNVGDILAAQLLFYRKNLTLISSVKGVLMDYLSYDIRSSSRINFQNFTAEEDEIFIGIVDPLAKTDLNVVDAQAIVASGELAVSVTDFPVGVPFEVNKYDTQQAGAVLVFRNGTQQFRNPANGTSGGNYQEIDSGNGLGNLIRFNDAPTIQSDSILVVSNGLISERPDGSMMAVIESLAGQIDAMIPTLADLAGVPETDFQAAPNNVDLKTFGDRVLDLENEVIPWQKKFLSSNVTGTGVVAALSFNNLEVGKTYRVSGKVRHANPGGVAHTVTFEILNGATTILDYDVKDTSTTFEDNDVTVGPLVFVATDDDLDFNVSAIGASNALSSGEALSYIILEELARHEITSQWT